MMVGKESTTSNFFDVSRKTLTQSGIAHMGRKTILSAVYKTATAHMEEAYEPEEESLGPLKSKAWIQAPAYFGESCLFQSEDLLHALPALYSCVCFSRCEFVTLTKEAVDRVLKEFPKVKARFAVFKSRVGEIGNEAKEKELGIVGRPAKHAGPPPP